MNNTLQDPREQYPKPPFLEQKQTPPGDTDQIMPQPDYGEHTYRGSGKLHNCAALITGADSVIGRAVALAYAREGADVLIAYLNEDEAFKPEPILLAYVATKAAIVNFTKNFSAQAIEKDIRVNAVAPGPVWTPLIPSTMPTEQVTKFGQQSPMKRPAQPAKLAPAYVFLASQEASYITGQVIGVTGGSPIN